MNGITTTYEELDHLLDLARTAPGALLDLAKALATRQEAEHEPGLFRLPPRSRMEPIRLWVYRCECGERFLFVCDAMDHYESAHERKQLSLLARLRKQLRRLAETPGERHPA